MVMATTQKGEDEGGERSISVLVLFLEVTGVRWLRQNQGVWSRQNPNNGISNRCQGSDLKHYS